MDVGQLTEKEPNFEAKFCRRIGKTSTFHWPVLEDKSVIEKEEIFMDLTSPSVDKRGKIIFSVTFDFN